MMRFLNKSVLVTGASSGIGAATAKMFAKEGAQVAIIARNETKLNEVARECEKLGPKPLVIGADLTKDTDAERIAKTTIDTFGKLDVLVNNAGVARYGSLLDGKVMSSYSEVMDTNLKAVVRMCALFTPHLVESKGNIVNVSSVSASAMPPKPRLLAYYFSKAALDHFSRCAAWELSKKGVRVNVVTPGPVKTDIVVNSGQNVSWDRYKILTALDNVSEPEEIAELILYVASDKAKSMTGSVVVSDNGFLLKH